MNNEMRQAISCVQNLHTYYPTCVFLAQVGVMTVKSQGNDYEQDRRA